MATHPSLECGHLRVGRRRTCGAHDLAGERSYPLVAPGGSSRSGSGRARAERTGDLGSSRGRRGQLGVGGDDRVDGARGHRESWIASSRRHRPPVSAREVDLGRIGGREQQVRDGLCHIERLDVDWPDSSPRRKGSGPSCTGLNLQLGERAQGGAHFEGDPAVSCTILPVGGERFQFWPSHVSVGHPEEVAGPVCSHAA